MATAQMAQSISAIRKLGTVGPLYAVAAYRPPYCSDRDCVRSWHLGEIESTRHPCRGFSPNVVLMHASFNRLPSEPIRDVTRYDGSIDLFGGQRIKGDVQ